tara:strand:+ start:196 stop:486 length:291 start_codon:yes stop_codon:yes gene_type:complete
MRKTDRSFSMIDEMLVVAFDVPVEDVREFKQTRRGKYNNFMQMKLWEELTEPQYNTLYSIIHNESIELFVELATSMNERLRRQLKNKRARERYNNR